MKFSIKDFFSKCDQIHSFLPIWSDLLKKYLMENFIFRAVDMMSIQGYVITWQWHQGGHFMEKPGFYIFDRKTGKF